MESFLLHYIFTLLYLYIHYIFVYGKLFASLYIYHFSTVVDFSSEKYSGSTEGLQVRVPLPVVSACHKQTMFVKHHNSFHTLRVWKNVFISHFMSSFREMTPQWIKNGCPKNCRLLKILYI